MRSSSMPKRIVEWRSTQGCLRNVQRSIHDLWTDLNHQIRYGSTLRTHCRGKTGILLNIGCGELIQPGWINIDFQPRSGAFYFNALNPLPMEDGTVCHIHTEHFLEHLEYSDALRFLGECHRVLKIGGMMRIIVPDAERYMRAYSDDDKTYFGRLTDLGGSFFPEPLPTKGAICNRMFRMGGGHRFAWDFETLEYVTRHVGFGAIERSCHNDGSAPHCIDGQDWWRPFESLYAQVTR
jgi:predicted SAM-dependent methyltransferase